MTEFHLKVSLRSFLLALGLFGVCLAQEPVEIPENQLDLVNPPATWKINNSIQRLVPIPLPPVQPATFTPADEQRGLVFYHRPNPRHCRFAAIPATWEINQHPRSFITPGQFEPLWFSIYTLAPQSQLSAKIAAPLKNEQGKTIPIEAIDIRYLRDWPALRSLYSASNYYIIPEVIEKKTSIDVPARQSRTIWLTVLAPQDAAPGLYRTVIEIHNASGLVTSVPMELRVLPFKLATPTDRYWGMYTTSSVRWGKMNDDAIRAELVDMKLAGINSLVIGMFGQTSPAVTVNKEDQSVTVSYPQLERLQRLRREVGSRGPLVLYAGPRLEEMLARARGERVDTFFGPLPQFKDETFNAQFRSILTQLDTIMKRTGEEPGYIEWMYAGIDEPGVSVGRHERSVWEFQQAKLAGFKTWSTLHGEFSNTIAPWTDIPVFHRGWSVNSAANNTARHEETRKFKQRYWVYGGGAYENQEGNLIQNRHHNGVLMYKSGIEGMVNWTYQWPSGDPMSDFVSGDKKLPGKKAMIVHNDPVTGEIIPTLQWVGTRSGIDDYRYLHTLDLKLAEARKLAQSRGKTNLAQLCEQIRKEIDARIAQVPWAHPMPESFDMEEFDNDRVHKFRWFVAQSILKLDEAMQERSGKGGGQ